MKKKYITVMLDENNINFLNKIRKEIMIENEVNIPLNKMLEIALIEFRQNNTEKEMKEKYVHTKRLGKQGMDGIISQL